MATPHPGARCANELCQKPLDDDPVIVVTTCHVRRFCHVECVIVGYHAHLDRIIREAR